MRRVLVPLAPNALEVFLLALCAWSGLSGLVTWWITGVIPQVRLDPWLAVGWLFLLGVGGLAGVIGSYLPDPILGGLVLRAALLPVAGGALTAAIGSAWRGEWPTAVVLTGLSVAAAWRTVQITRRNRNLVQVERE